MNDFTRVPPTFADAKARSVVFLKDGRTGRLVYLPGDKPGRAGSKARVILPGDRWISVDPEDISLV